MARRLKEWNTRNVADSGETIKDFFDDAIGHANVLVVDSTTEEGEQLAKMQEIIEQKGKPCCINMITESDKKFLDGLAKAAAKEARAKARAERAEAAAVDEGGSVPGGDETARESAPADLESEEEVDEITQLI